MEHLVPEQMFSTEENKAEGISAVKAIAIAAAEGQKIYTITNENLETALANITLAEDTETEIRNSVNAGYVVTAHENQINFNGWLGEGYIITDPITGDAAYKISGGGNGAVLILAGLFIMLMVFMSIVPILAAGAATSGVLAVPGFIYLVGALFTGVNLVGAGVALASGSALMCNIFLSLGIATLATMIGGWLAGPAAVLWSIFGIGGGSGTALLGLLRVCE